MHNKQSGFALLMTLIVVGVILSIGLSVLDLSIKQIRLSTNAKESEIAFHAANAGMECARYWRRTESDDIELGLPITPDCFGGTLESNTIDASIVPPASNDDGEIFLYEYQITWDGDDRCTDVSMLIVTSIAFGDGVIVPNVPDYIAGYPGDANPLCQEGSRCTTLSVKGYNKHCDDIATYGTVEREVLLEL